MSMDFNLVNDPWLPCIRADGEYVQMGLRDTLAQSHTLQEMYGETPLTTAALHRLMLSVLHRVFGPENLTVWSNLWRHGRWDTSALDAYWSRWQSRFNLFDASYPFYQTSNPTTEPKAVNSLALELAYNSTLFEHHLQDRTLAILPDLAARWLVTLQASGIGTGPPTNPYPAGPLVNALIVMPYGRTLFETLMFNLIQYPDDNVMPVIRDDYPFWEYDVNPFPPSPTTFYCPGYLGYLTWQCRTVRLLPSWEAGTLWVRECCLSQGARWNNQLIQDPMKVYKQSAKKDTGMQPLRLNEDRAMWRDADALFRLHDADVRPPIAFRQLSIQVSRGVLEASQVYNYVTLGLCNDNARLEFARQERMPLSLELLAREEMAEILRESLAQAEESGQIVGRAGRHLAAWLLSPADPSKPRRDQIEPVAASFNMERRFWSRLEVRFRDFVENLPKNVEAAQQMWVADLLHAARQAFEEGSAGVTDPARGYKAVAIARRRLESDLTAIRARQPRTSQSATKL